MTSKYLTAFCGGAGGALAVLSFVMGDYDGATHGLMVTLLALAIYIFGPEERL